MRKFRVWNKKYNCIVESTWAITDDGELINLQSDTDNLNQDDYVIQFFTGLFDKNNTEIFEGDLLLFSNKQLISEVVYKNGAFWVCGKNFMANDFLFEWADSYEVIGNILENP